MKKGLLLLLAAALLNTGCETDTGTGALAGAGLGAGVGALAGGRSGALIGAAVGSATGAAVGSVSDAQKRKEQQKTGRCPTRSEIMDLYGSSRNDDEFVDRFKYIYQGCGIDKGTASYLEGQGISRSTVNQLPRFK